VNTKTGYSFLALAGSVLMMLSIAAPASAALPEGAHGVYVGRYDNTIHAPVEETHVSLGQAAKYLSETCGQPIQQEMQRVRNIAAWTAGSAFNASCVIGNDSIYVSNVPVD
jgi:hypothetical protein